LKRERAVHGDLALKLTADLFWTGLLVSLPVLGLTMLAGLVVSILQAITQIQEMSLSFVPKLLVAGVAIIAFGPWMLRTLCRFAIGLWSQIPTLV
jgi:flagellar biosynthetic protein FliQ